MAPNPPACSFIHASMAGSRSTAPLNRRNCALIVATVFALEICSYLAFLLPSSAPASVLGPWSPPARAGLRPTIRHWITLRIARRPETTHLLLARLARGNLPEVAPSILYHGPPVPVGKV